MPRTGIHAVLLERPGVDWERQFAACQAYAERRGYALVSVTDSPEAALALLGAGVAEVIVAAFDRLNDGELEKLADRAGGRLEYCRPPRRRPKPAGDPEDEIILRMARHGGTEDEIVRLLGVSAQRVREILRRHR